MAAEKSLSYHPIQLDGIGRQPYGPEEMMTSFHVRRGTTWLAVALSLAMTACGDDPSGPSQSGSVNVTDSGFNPEDIVVAAGATVTWTWTGSLDHSVTFASASITDSPTQASGTFSTTMPTTPGTYAYVCSEHPVAMTGSVQVQ
jgi:plastocyanin